MPMPPTSVKLNIHEYALNNSTPDGSSRKIFVRTFGSSPLTNSRKARILLPYHIIQTADGWKTKTVLIAPGIFSLPKKGRKTKGKKKLERRETCQILDDLRHSMITKQQKRFGCSSSVLRTQLAKIPIGRSLYKAVNMKILEK